MFQSAESSLHVLFIRASKQHRQPAMSMTLLIYQATVGTAMRIEFKLASVPPRHLHLMNHLPAASADC